MLDPFLTIRLPAPLTDARYGAFAHLEAVALSDLTQVGLVPPGWAWDREGYFRRAFDAQQARKAARAARKARGQ